MEEFAFENRSFSSRVKEELIHQEYDATETSLILSSFIKSNGVIRVSGGVENLDLSTEYEGIADFLYRAITMQFHLDCRFSCVRSMKGKGTMRFHVIVSEPEVLMQRLGIDFLSNKPPKEISEGKDGAKHYVIGAFLSCGYVNSPVTSNYHLEFSFANVSYGERFMRLLNKVQGSRFEFKTAKRRSQTIVYIKKSERISEFLVFMGAQQSCLDFESIRVDRDFANIGNRLSNLDKANEGKKTKAAERQIEEIRFLQSIGALEEMENPKISILASLRLENPDASMEELSELFSYEIGAGVSKSNINHLFRAIHERYLYKKEGTHS